MSTLENIKKDLGSSLEKLNARIIEHSGSPNNLLNDVSEYFLQKKGKQIRPILTLLLASLFENPNQNTIDGAAAIELLHSASLLHDDVVDQSDMRRGLPTVNKLWGNQIAVLVGDFFVTSALALAVDTGDLRIVGAINRLGRRLAIGELDQINNVRTSILDREAYLKMIERKTASLFAACSQIACFSIGAEGPKAEAVEEFARLMGICFQIKDDTFDYLPDFAEQLGKPVGADLMEGKISLPLLHVLLTERQNGNEEIVEMALKEEKSPEEVNYLLNYAVEKGGMEYSLRFMDGLYEKAEKLLTANFPATPTRQHLLTLFRYVIDREK